MSSSSNLNPESFFRLVSQSRLIDRITLKNSWKELKNAGCDLGKVTAIADALVLRNLLTRWQADKLLLGKHKGFFLGKYRLLSHLGSGGMSAVYLAEHVLMRRRVALKVLPKARVDDSSYLQRFHREAQAVAALDHRNIVRAYDVDQEGDTHFLVMEYVQGQNLHELTVKSGKLDFVPAVEYARQAAEGLQHAHRMGMVHRDIKPGNLLLDEKGIVKLLDLGLARFFEDAEENSLTIEHNETVLGTADYLSPEQALDSHNVDLRSDIYSLGCTLFFLLAGHPPFPEGTMAKRLLAHQLDEPRSIRRDRPDIPDSLVSRLSKMMAKNPDDRFQTAKETSAALLQWLMINGGATWSKMNPVIPGSNSLGSSVAGLPGSSVVRSGKPSRAPTPAAENKQLDSDGSTPSAAEAAPADTKLFGITAVGREVIDYTADRTGNVGAAPTEPELAAFFSSLDQPEPPEITPQTSTAILAPTATGTTRDSPPPDFSPSDAAISESPAPSASDFESLVAGPSSPVVRIGESDPFSFPVDAPLARSARRQAVKSASQPARPAPGPNGHTADFRKWLTIAAPILGIALVAGFVYFGRGETGSTPEKPANQSNSTKADRPNKKTSRPPAVAVRREWKVGAAQEFKTIGAALRDAKRQVPKGRKSVLTIKVAAGESFAERIEIDEKFPRGIQIVAEEGPPPVLAPIGPEPAVVVRGGTGKNIVDDFRLEGFRIEAAGKAIAVQLSEWIPGVRLIRLQIRGFQQSGVLIDGAQTYGSEDKRIVLERLTFSHAAPDAVGVVFRESSQAPSHVRVVGCRFIAPLAAGIKIGSNTIGLDIDESIFFRTRSGVVLEGAQREWRDIGFAFNTFYENESALVFSEMPGPNSNGFGFYNNLFFGSRTADAVVKANYNVKTFLSMYRVTPGGSGHNWTTRARDETPLAGDLVYLFETRQGQFGATGLQFRSLDPETPDFLAPVSGSPHAKVGTMLDAKKFGLQIGADISRRSFDAR